MSEYHVEEHHSPIRTPQQLILVVVLSFVVPVIALIMIAGVIVGSLNTDKENPALAEAAVDARIKPVGEVVIGDASGASALKSGEEVVKGVCTACHGAGLLGAPKIGDKAAWAKLIPQGLNTLLQAAVKGIRQMPPKGGDTSLADIEVARAIVYMANQSGGNLKEPAAPAAAVVATAAPDAPVVVPLAPTTGAPMAPPAAAAQPAAAPAVAQVAAATPGRGKQVYDQTCQVCHAAGIAGAPKAGDKAAWAPRIKQGLDTLHASALKGKGAMPVKGGNTSLTDADVKAAVDYMVGLAK